MERCVCFHRFGILLWLSLVAPCGMYARAPEAGMVTAQASTAKVLLVSAGSSPAQNTAVSASQQTKGGEYVLSRERYEKAVTYSRAAYTMYFVSVALNVLALVLVLRLKVAGKFRDWAESVTDKRWLQALIFVPLLLLTVDVVALPLRLYGHVLSLRYEMSVQSWGSWIADWSKEQVLMAGFALIFAFILSAMIRRSPRRWWMYLWVAALPITILIVFISPWFIDPLFNKFEPLQAEHADLVASIENLTRHAGVPIPAERMFLMRAGEKTNEVDAYVTGLGASKRVVIWDTTIQKATPNETLFIVGHELGHYVLGHIWKGFLFAAMLMLIGFYALFRALHWSLDRWSGDWGIYGPEGWAALAVLLLLLEIGMFLVAPIANGFSRMQEHAADVYGLEVTHGVIPDSSEVAADSFQVLGEVDLADPNPSEFVTIWLYSHPPLAERLAFARSYDPWSRGESPKYVK